jgi:hypothetical protein
MPGRLFGKISALDERTDEIRLAFDLAGVVDRDDVWMPEDAGAPGLAEETVDRAGSVERAGPRPLQGHGPIQRSVPSPVDDPERALADHVAELVPADARRRRAIDRFREVRFRSSLRSRPPAQFGFSRQQLAEGVGVVGQVGEPRQVASERERLAGLGPDLHLLVEQFDQQDLAVDIARGGIVFDFRPFAPSERLTKGPDSLLDGLPGQMIQLGS